MLVTYTLPPLSERLLFPPHHQQGAVEGSNFASGIYKPKTKAFRKEKEMGGRGGGAGGRKVANEKKK